MDMLHNHHYSAGNINCIRNRCDAACMALVKEALDGLKSQ